MVNTASLSWLHQLGTTCGTANKLKCCTSLNTFKHKIIEYFLQKITQKDNDIYLYDQTLVSITTGAWLAGWLAGWLAD